MGLTLKSSGLLDLLENDRDQLVCDAYKLARVDTAGGAGNEQFTADSVKESLDYLYNRTVGQTLSWFDQTGFFTVANAGEGTITDLVHQQMADDWFESINTQKE